MRPEVGGGEGVICEEEVGGEEDAGEGPDGVGGRSSGESLESWGEEVEGEEGEEGEGRGW